ncbi:toxin-antitoxin system YwqK family antitoxin [Gaetbulibacter aestuarii]|uniref:MORN repeat protein n=1 Tax=Gaetbulibacter aestuarii TaxID=1502358 RepID=A0ABW7MV60_9FLAO
MSKKVPNLLLVLLCTLSLIHCKNSEETSDEDFMLIPRGSYYTDSFNDIVVYRDSDSNELMDGYYVVGDKFQKWEEFEVKKGILNGDYLVFHSNGEIFSHSIYKNGRLHGKNKVYHLNGAVKTEESYVNGKLYGTTLTYDENGALRTEAKIKNENVVESVTYDAIGEIQSQMFIRNSRKITQHVRAGKVYMESISSTYDNFEAMKFYNEDGSLKAFVRMLEDGEDAYLIELDENENEIKRINLKANPMEAQKFMQSLQTFAGLDTPEI